MKVTKHESAAICALICGIITNWLDCYLIAMRHGDKTAAEIKNLNSTVSRWRNSAKIQEEYKRIEAELNNRFAVSVYDGREKEEEKEEERREEKESSKSRGRDLIDYNKPEERRKAYNKIIRESQDDPKTQLDALKIIEQLQKDDKQAAKDNEIQRFYTPVKCSLCPLYERAKRKTL